MNFDRLRHVAERAEIGEHREALLAVTIPERPGSFLRFCETLGARTITEFNYRYAPGARRDIFVGVSAAARARARRARSSRLLRARRLSGLDMSDNEMAKLHVRHMVGGRAAVCRTSCSIASSSPSGRARCWRS